MLSILYFHRQNYNIIQNNIARFANLIGVRQKKNSNLCTISMALFP